MGKLTSKEKLYKLIIEDFINTSKIEDAVEKTVEKIQMAFDLPYAFIEKQKEYFLFLNKIRELDSEEKKLCQSVSLEKELREMCSQHFLSLNLDFESYDCQKETIIFSENENHPNYYFEEDTGYADYGTFEVCIHSIAQFDRKVLEPWLCQEIEELINIGKEIKGLEKVFPQERIDELVAISDSYRFFELLYERSGNVSVRIIGLLLQLLRNQKLDEKSIDYFVLKKKHDEFFKIEPKERYLTNDSDSEGDLWCNIYESAICASFFIFFSSERHKKLVHKCEECKKFFISGKIDKRIKFCTICSPKNRWTKEKRRGYRYVGYSGNPALRIPSIKSFLDASSLSGICLA